MTAAPSAAPPQQPTCKACSRTRAFGAIALLGCGLASTSMAAAVPAAPFARLAAAGTSAPAAFIRHPALSPAMRQGVPYRSSLQAPPVSASGRRRMTPVCAADLGMAIYDLQIWAKEVVDNQLTHLTPVSGAILYGAGLLTSLSPCALSLVPLTMAYLTDDGDEEGSKGTLFFRAAMFTVGLALSLSVLGLSATLAGRLFGSVGGGAGTVLGALLPLSASVVAILMGLNLLDLVKLSLPSIEASLNLDGIPPAAQAFLLGGSSALIASPCSTPVLASILGFVATSQEPYLGVGLLFSYSLGYSTPLLVAGLVSGAVTSFIRSKGDGFSWVTPATAAVLISYGTYSGLNTLFPPAF